MNEYIFLMHDDVPETRSVADWGPYLARLRESGQFDGGSAIGAGACVNKSGAAAILSPVSGFIRVRAESLSHARALLAGNPVFEAGGTVEIRELPRGD